MRSIIALVAALALGGCSDQFDTLFGSGAITVAAGKDKPDVAPASDAAKTATADKLDAHAIAKRAICDWGKAAGIPDLKPGITDTVGSRRRMAEVQAAYKTTCLVAAAPVLLPASSAAGVKAPVPGAAGK